MLNKILLWIEKKSPHYKLRKYFPRHSQYKLKSKPLIGICTINMNHAELIGKIIRKRFYKKIKSTRNETYIRMKKCDVIIFSVSREERGCRFNKLIVYEPVLEHKNMFEAVMPRAVYCAKKDVFIIQDGKEEEVLKWIKKN